jgi:phage tail protein X
MQLEKARLALRAEHGVAADRGRIVRAALAYVLEDFAARADDSILIRHLSD